MIGQEISEISMEHETENLSENEEIVYESADFPGIFYAKRTMKDLLQQRNQVWKTINISKKQMITQQQNRKIMELLVKLFDECPSEIDEGYFAIMKDNIGYYVFLSSDAKFVPLCKNCNISTYATIRQGRGRIICGNVLCRKKILGEFTFEVQKEKISRLTKIALENLAKSKQIVSEHPKSTKRQLNRREKQLISKAAKKVMKD